MVGGVGGTSVGVVGGTGVVGVSVGVGVGVGVSVGLGDGGGCTKADTKMITVSPRSASPPALGNWSTTVPRVTAPAYEGLLDLTYATPMATPDQDAG